MLYVLPLLTSFARHLAKAPPGHSIVFIDEITPLAQSLSGVPSHS